MHLIKYIIIISTYKNKLWNLISKRMKNKNIFRTFKIIFNDLYNFCRFSFVFEVLICDFIVHFNNYKIQLMMKKTLIAMVLMCFLIGAYSQCPSRCSNCANSTSCTTCQAGYFLVNQTSCPQCPPGCSACNAGVDGRPVCTACTAPAQLANGKCFLCDPSCETCTGSPRNCASCPAGKIIRARSDSTQECIDDPNCTIPNCLNCVTLP